MKRGLFLFGIIFVLLLNFVSSYEIFYYHTDNLGSPIAVTNSSGDVVWSADYEPFGKSFNEFSGDNDNNPLLPSPPPAQYNNNNYKYNSKELDKSGLLYYGARYYDADIGRFTTADTIKGDIRSPQTLNRYAYVLNNPMKYVDPTGRRMKLTSMEHRDNVMNWMNEVTGETYFWINEEGSFQYVGGFEGSKEQRKIYNLFVDIIENKNVVSLSVGEDLASESTSSPPSKATSVSIQYADFWAPLGEEGTFIYFNPQVVLVHELAHARGQMEGNGKPGEFIALKYENYARLTARRVPGLDKRIFYAFGQTTSTITGMPGVDGTVNSISYEYFLPEHWDKASSIAKRLGLVSSSYTEGYYFYPESRVVVSKLYPEYDKKGKFIGFKQ